jgi:hypothetical protein
MPRPIKTGAEYFSHDANASSDIKLQYIEGKFGLTGYAMYFKFLELMARENNYELAFNEMTKPVIAKIIGVDLQTVVQFANSICNNSMNIFTLENGYLSCSGLKKRLLIVEEKREYYREYRQQKRTNIGLQTEQSSLQTEQPELNSLLSTQRKVKESKVKDTSVLVLEKKEKKKKDFDADKSSSEGDRKFIIRLIEIFTSRYEESRNFPYVVSKSIRSKDSQSIVAVFKKVVETKERKLGIKLNTEEAIDTFDSYIKNAMMITDPFIHNGMTPAFLLNQFQKVLTLMMENNLNGKRQKSPELSPALNAYIDANFPE